MPRADDPESVQVVVARLEGVHEKLDEIYVEVKRTNGRVTLLEQQAAVNKALETRHMDGRDWTLRLLLGVIALASVLEPIVLHFTG